MSCLNDCTKCNTTNWFKPFNICNACGKTLLFNKECEINTNHPFLINPDEFTEGSEEYLERLEYVNKLERFIPLSTNVQRFVNSTITKFLEKEDSERWDPLWLKYTEYLSVNDQNKLKEQMFIDYYYQHPDLFQPIT